MELPGPPPSYCVLDTSACTLLSNLCSAYKLRHNTVVESSGCCPRLVYISLGPMQFAACSGNRYFTTPVVFHHSSRIYRNSGRDTRPHHEQTTWTITDLPR